MRYGFLLTICFIVIRCGTSKHPASDQNESEYLILNPSIQIFEIDPLGHLYILDGNDRLSKFDTTDHLLYHVVNNNLGRVQSLDVGNPFKLLAFYRDQQTIIMYDRTLSEIQRIRLSDWNFQDVTAVCLSPDNAIWLFDGMNKVLIKADNSGNPIITSDPFDIIRPGSPRPDFIYDADHLLLLKETNHSISVFNDFGNYLYSTEFKEDEIFSVSNDIVVMSSGYSIQMYDISDRRMLTPITLKENVEAKRIYLFANQFYVSDNKGVYIINP